MRLKAIAASAVATLALSGLMAGAASADPVSTPTPEELAANPGMVVEWPSDQEMAEHPGMGHTFTCPTMSSKESEESQFTDKFVERLNREGKCKAWWTKEEPLTPEELAATHVVSGKGKAAKHVRKAAAKKAKRHHRHHRHR